MKKVMNFLVDYDKYCLDGVQRLTAAGFEIAFNRYGRAYSADELAADAADADAIIADTEIWDETAFAAAPRIKCLVRFGTGMNNVDLDAAKRRGVIVANTPGYNANAVAEQTIALLFAMARFVSQLDADVRSGKWTRPMYREMAGKTVGILGFGAIGQKSAEKLSSFDVKVIAYDKFPNQEAAAALNVRFGAFDEVLRESDYLLVHLPLLQETRGIINSSNIAKMKDGVFIVNTGRGLLVDEKSVAAAIGSGKIAGMASDVFAIEPPAKDNPLFACRNYICTPHISGSTYENMRNTGIAAAEAIIAVFAGKEPLNRHA
jgi:D-3-phosphoglycerate dehydrogenase